VFLLFCAKKYNLLQGGLPNVPSPRLPGTPIPNGTLGRIFEDSYSVSYYCNYQKEKIWLFGVFCVFQCVRLVF
jgi:hypothetical protein